MSSNMHVLLITFIMRNTFKYLILHITFYFYHYKYKKTLWTWILQSERSQTWKEKRGMFMLPHPIIILGDTIRFLFKRPFLTWLSSPMSQETSTADTWWKIFLKWQRSGNKSSQIFHILLCLAVISKNS